MVVETTTLGGDASLFSGQRAVGGDRGLRVSLVGEDTATDEDFAQRAQTGSAPETRWEVVPVNFTIHEQICVPNT